MGVLDTVSIAILLGALLVLGGILSSLIAMRFGAPLLLVFLLVGLLAGEGGPGGIVFNDVQAAYTVGSIALAIILFDGGLRTRFAIFRSVLAPSLLLSTVGVLLTTALVAPVAKLVLGFGWIESVLVGAVVASTDAAAVFFLAHARGLRLRPRVGAILEVESGTNDPFAIFLTVMLIRILLINDQSFASVIIELVKEALLGGVLGILGGLAMVFVINRLNLAQGLHAPFVTTAAVVIFGFASAVHSSGFLAVYLAGLIVGNQATRAQGTLIVFLDAITWLAQIAMFVMLGLLAWPDRLWASIVPALLVAFALMFIARPAAVFLCLAPFRFTSREKLFISWVGLRGSVGIFLAAIPLLVGLPNAQLYFDIGFIVVLVSLLVQGWTVAPAAGWLHVALPRADKQPRRIELDLPGQLEQELVGYFVAANSPFLRRGLIPSWAKPTLFVRDEKIMTPDEAVTAHEGDYVYLLAPPEKAQALDRFFVNMPAPPKPDARLLGDFFVSGDATLGALAEIYGLQIAGQHSEKLLSAHFTDELGRAPRAGDIVQMGPIALLADKVTDGRVTTVGLRLADPDQEFPDTVPSRAHTVLRRLQKIVTG